MFNLTKRSVSLWSNIYNSFGWPTELPGYFSKELRIEIAREGVIAAIPIALEYPVQAAGKVFVNSWRLLVIFLFIVSLLFSYNNKINRRIILLSLSFIVIRTIFSGYINYIETRYTLTQMPIMEISVVLFLLSYRARKLIDSR